MPPGATVTVLLLTSTELFSLFAVSLFGYSADDSPLETPAPVSSDVPFSDGQGLTTYVMGKYQKLGPEKGALIQGVLNNLGYQNINDVKPEHYSALHSGIEAL